MRAIKGVINGILLVTLVKPMVRVMVGRWRKRMQEMPATAIGIQVQELFEAALIEELAPTTIEPEATAADVTEVAASSEGRSVIGFVLVAGVVVAVVTASAYAVRELLRRRRPAHAAERELVAVPIELGEAEPIEDVALEALAEEG
jgi:hypothetical protein